MIAMSVLNTLQFESPLHKVFSSNTLGGTPLIIGGRHDLTPQPLPKGFECCCEKDYLCIFNYLIKHKKNPPNCPCGNMVIRGQKGCPCGSEGCPCGSEGCPCGGEGCPEDEPPCEEEVEEEEEDGETADEEGEADEDDATVDGEEDSAEDAEEDVEEEEEDSESDDSEEAEVQEDEISGSNDGLVIESSGKVEASCPDNSIYDEEKKVCRCKLGYSANATESECERDALGFVMESKWWILGGLAALGAYGYHQSR